MGVSLSCWGVVVGSLKYFTPNIDICKGKPQNTTFSAKGVNETKCVSKNQISMLKWVRAEGTDPPQ